MNFTVRGGRRNITDMCHLLLNCFCHYYWVERYYALCIYWCAFFLRYYYVATYIVACVYKYGTYASVRVCVLCFTLRLLCLHRAAYCATLHTPARPRVTFLFAFCSAPNGYFLNECPAGRLHPAARHHMQTHSLDARVHARAATRKMSGCARCLPLCVNVS